ncbi:hypothetical protein QBL02_10150 [Leucobacter sp. UT-8R-CII-1-4]|uniref:alpha/beta hydrolase n=1 Tax=Leucobacter sp. UT-8R-CII-1-4 TaxID=3040075 RepID=UPI0024A9DBB8|nr:hypothetical protein [Leucobacter sp. UT-8R-CII-1-4]MDI6023903.1 hypothetical protein [Leucobacter sp. UT-8R-CII-1-4]
MSEVSIDDGVVLWSVDGRGVGEADALTALQTRPLLVLMHGFGSFEGDLIELAGHLPKGFVCASPRAPLVAPAPIVNGFAWWQLPLSAQGLPLPQADPESFEGSGPHTAALATLAWLDTLDARVRAHSVGSPAGEVGLGTIALMGFSQGGCMVTSLLRIRPDRFVCGVNCSGFVGAGAFDGDEKLREIRPPMFWGRDVLDPIIDDHRIALTTEWAPTHTELEARLYDGILHGIGAAELADITAFLERHVPEVRSA